MGIQEWIVMKRLGMSLFCSSIFSVAATVVLILGFWLGGIYLTPLVGLGIYIVLVIIFGGVFYRTLNWIDKDDIEFEVVT